MKNSYTYKFFHKFIIILFLLAIIPLLVLCFYIEPSLDDYSYANELLTNSFLDSQIYNYLHWGSRYTATAILITNPISWGCFFGYKIIALFMILFFVGSSFFMFTQISKNKKLSYLLTAFFCFIYFFLLPDICSAFYWLPGSATYHLANILFLLFVGILVKTTKYNSTYLKVLLFILTFFIIGCNETSMVYLDIFIFSLCVYTFYTKKKLSTFYISLFIWAGILTLFILLAPGNSARSNLIINPLPLTEIIIRSFRKTIVIILRYGLLTFLINLLIFYSLRKQLINIKLNFLKLPLYFYLLLFFILIPLGSFPTLSPLGIYPPLRTVNIVFFILLLFSMIFCYKLVTHPAIYNISLSESLLSVSLFILVFGYTFVIGNKDILSLTNNLYYSYDNLISGSAKEYKKEVNKRYTIIKQSKEDTVYVPPLQSKPKIIFESDLRSDPGHFYNQNMAKLFNKKAIILKTDNEK